MSRFDDGWEPDFPNQEALLLHNEQQAIKGRRGQAFLRELIAVLDAMPDKRLVEGTLATRKGAVCAVGAVAAARLNAGQSLKLHKGRIYQKTVRSVKELAALCRDPEDGDDWENFELTLDVGEALGIARSLATAISRENDEAYMLRLGEGEDHDQRRWREVREWAERQLTSPIEGKAK